ncbi:hypothetical protein EVAR_29924_1 [Eumeta japonica]|uniref:Uncharacterized protein n=1 Tax=Eumeta variegata TaxID=151549 RepID=A0A4C1V882_EUMVA|nr:hypothetical protein EVAR_29924_1 [Eumeta japonica]
MDKHAHILQSQPRFRPVRRPVRRPIVDGNFINRRSRGLSSSARSNERNERPPLRIECDRTPRRRAELDARRVSNTARDARNERVKRNAEVYANRVGGEGAGIKIEGEEAASGGAETAGHAPPDANGLRYDAALP